MLSSVLKTLPKLKPDELEKVRQRVAFLLSTAPAASNPENDWLLDGVAGELRRRGLWMHNYPIPDKIIPSDYQAKAEAVRNHLLAGYSAINPRTVERMALGGLAATALADYLTRAHAPLGPKTLLGNIEKVPLALEESFPGYWEKKLLGFCIKVKS